DPRTLEVRAQVGTGGAPEELFHVGARIGLLGIELETRRRNRMNGTIIEADAERFVVRVDQSFGNCPKYIVKRFHRFADEPSHLGSRSVFLEGPRLSAASIELIERADTFFIATASSSLRSADPAEGLDVSHRGGSPGFVRASDESGSTTLVAPDYVGNSHFNTFGNLERNPRAGLLFVDFEKGDVLALTGEAEVVWDGPEIATFDGALRLLRFRVSVARRIEAAIPLRWSPAGSRDS
ncbi:MAG: pyridoxamine 5'-phosphate oxidase family protein, partial [Polyangiaceae bacterium]|nr:pyridoxamine 5'-phosphate oxidase family protein [Polyangiaceae bacterium]